MVSSSFFSHSLFFVIKRRILLQATTFSLDSLFSRVLLVFDIFSFSARSCKLTISPSSGREVVKLQRKESIFSKSVHSSSIKMMNSYFDHSSTAGFYNPAHQAAAEAHQAAYRSFSQNLSLLPSATQSYGQSGTRSNSTPSEASNNYVDAACKLYDGSQSSSNFKSSDCISKETNGFKTPSNSDPMTPTSAWNSTSALRPSPSSVSMAGIAAAADPMRSFDAAAAACSRSVTDAWSACCQGTSAGSSANFYPWMAIAGKINLVIFL